LSRKLQGAQYRYDARNVEALAAQVALAAWRHLPISQRFIFKNLAVFSFFKGQESVADTLDVLFAQLTILFPQILTQGLIPEGSINKLHLPFAMLWFTIAQHPDVGGDAGVVKKIEREGDDRFEPVVLEDPAADLALALATVTIAERGTIEDDGDLATASSSFGGWLHLGENGLKEEECSITHSGHTCYVSGLAESLGFGLVSILPAPGDTEGRVTQHIIEAICLVGLWKLVTGVFALWIVGD